MNGRTSPPGNSGESANGLPSLKKASYPAKKEEEVVTLSSFFHAQINPEIDPDPIHPSQSHSLSNRGLGPYDWNGTETIPTGSPQIKTDFGSVVPEQDRKTDFSRVKTQNRLVDASDPTAGMLSSTMVSVLAPHWSGCLRRNKRGVVNGELGQDAQGNLQEVTHGQNSEANLVHQQFLETQRQHGWERWSRDRFQPQERSTVGWSTLSGPPSINLNYPIKRPVVQSVSLDVDPGRLDNRGIDGDALNLADKFEPPISPLSLNLQVPSRASLAVRQEDQSSPSSSKPTTSSLLLSLRRLNSNLSPTQSETNPPSVTCSTNERAAELSRAHPSPTSPNNNQRDRSNERRQTVLSPSSPNHRRDCFSVSPNSKDSEGSPFSNLPQTTMKTYPNFSYPSKQTFLTSALSTPEKPKIDKTADPVTDASLPSPRSSQYDRFAFLKSQTLPRGTTLRTTSWWKHVTQEGSLPLSHNNTTTIANKNKNDSSTVSLTPSKNNLASQSTNDNGSFSCQISKNRENNNAVESFHPDNHNISSKKGTANTLKQSNAQDSPDPNSENYFNLNEREPPKPQSLPSTLFRTKIRSVAGQTAMSHTKDLSMPDDVSDRPYRCNETEKPLTSLDTKSQNTPKASHSNPQTYHHVPQTGNDTLTSFNSFRPNYNFCPLSFDGSEARNPDSQSHLKSPSSISISQNTIETSVLTSENTPPSPAFYTPRSLSILTTTNVKSSQTTAADNHPLQTEIKPNLTLTKQSLSLDTTHMTSGQALLRKAVSSSYSLPQPKTPPSSGRQPLSPLNSRSCVSPSPLTPHPRSPKVSNTITTTTTQLLGFERTYISISKSLHPKTLSTLSPTSALLSPKTNYSPISTSSILLTSSTTPCYTNTSLPTSTTLSSSFLTPPISPALTRSTTTMTTSSPLTPQATHNLASPLSPTNSPPQGERTFTGSLDLSPKKQHSHVEGRKVTGVTWQDLVDQQGSEAASKSQESGTSQLSPQPPTSPLSPSRPRTPSIFSFLRLSSPTRTVLPLSPPSPKTSSIQVCEGGKNQPSSLPSDPADQAACREGGKALASGQESISRFTFDHGGADSTIAETERKLSEEESAALRGSSALLSLCPDFGSEYKLRYSSPPYSTLKCTRSARAEATTAAPTSPLSPQPSSPPKSLTALPLALHSAPAANVTSPHSKPPRSPITSPQPLSIPFQNRTGSQESSKFVAMDTNHVNNNNCKQSNQDGRNSQTSHVDTKAGIRSQSLLLQSEKALSSPSARVSVVETLVYRIPKVDSTAALGSAKPKPLLQQTPNTWVALETKFKRQSHPAQSSEVMVNSHCRSQQSSYGSSSKENQCPSLARADDDCSDRRMKEAGVCRSRFFLSESKSEMPPLPSPKRGLFTLKKRDSVCSMASDSSTPDKAIQPSPDTMKSETDRSQRSSKKIDQVLSKLRQKFSAKRLDDDLAFPWRCKPPSKTPSVSGSSDVSDVSNNTVDSNKTLEEEREHKRIEVDRDSCTRMEEREIWTENVYTLNQSSAVRNRTGCGRFSNLEKTTTENDQSKDSVFELFQKDRSVFTKEQVTETESQSCLTCHSPTRHDIGFYGDKRVEHKPKNQSLPRDISSARQQLWDPNRSATFPTHRRNSTASPRSPFSPFTFLSPFSPADAMDDSVFYSPELQRRKESTSPCKSGDWFSLVDSGRTQASTGPCSGDPCQEKDRLPPYSCADLKYGLEAGRSFSVSSVMSSRPSGPGRISTGSWVLSVSDLSDPTVTFGKHSSGATGLDQWSVTSDRSSRNNCKSMDDYRATSDYRVSTIPSDPSKMRSRSLPRSFTRSLSTWGSEVTDVPSPTTTTTTTKPGRLWRPANLDITHFTWDTEGPPTPPPSPPWSPASRRMSKSPSLSSPCSPSSPSSPGPPQDNQSLRGHLPSRGYVSSLTAFDETDSSDTSSDTTTDDEYYLEMEEGQDKETEL